MSSIAIRIRNHDHNWNLARSFPYDRQQIAVRPVRQTFFAKNQLKLLPRYERSGIA